MVRGLTPKLSCKGFKQEGARSAHISTAILCQFQRSLARRVADADVRFVGPAEFANTHHCSTTCIQECCRLARKVGAHSQNTICNWHAVQGTLHQ